MSVTLSDLTNRARVDAAANGITLRLGHLQQATASMLGYKTLAAYQAAVIAGMEASNLASAKYLIPDSQCLTTRVESLGLPPSLQDDLVEAVYDSFRTLLPELRIHTDENELFEDLRLDIEVDIINRGEFAGAQVDAGGSGLPELELEFLGDVGGLADAERVYAFDIEGPAFVDPYDGAGVSSRVNVSATVMFDMVGKRLLDSFRVVDVEASPDYGSRYDPEES